MSKETYYSVKRDLLYVAVYAVAVLVLLSTLPSPRAPCWWQYTQCQKRPSTVSKETYYSVKRDLLYVAVYAVAVLVLLSTLPSLPRLAQSCRPTQSITTTQKHHASCVIASRKVVIVCYIENPTI